VKTGRAIAHPAPLPAPGCHPNRYIAVQAVVRRR
jgi:hypothetical protein